MYNYHNYYHDYIDQTEHPPADSKPVMSLRYLSEEEGILATKIDDNSG